MNIIEKAENELRDSINIRQVEKTSVSTQDYFASLAGFLYYDGKLELAEELLKEVPDDPMAKYLEVAIRFRNEGWHESLKQGLEQFSAGINPASDKIQAMWDAGMDDVTTVSRMRRAAFAGDTVAVLRMAEFCHDGTIRKSDGFFVPRGSTLWQDRGQECWWREFHLRMIRGAADKVMYHAFNQMEHSYDRGYSPDEIKETLLVAAALGSEQAVEYLIRFLTRNPDDPVGMKKALYWLYLKKEKYGLSMKEEGLLKKAEGGMA